MRRDYASLLIVDTKSNESYRIRFTAFVTEKMLNGIKYVYLHKTDNHIIVTPLSDEWKAEQNPYAIPIHRIDRGKAAAISLNNLVKNERWLPKGFFGKRYKVKRDKKGKIYICLKEEVTDD